MATALNTSAAGTAGKTHIDPMTGRLIRQLTFGEPHILPYFRYTKYLPDGRIMMDETGGLLLIDPESGDLEHVDLPKMRRFKFREDTATLWFLEDRRTLHRMEGPHGTLEQVATLPENLPGGPTDLTADGKTMILLTHDQDSSREVLNLPASGNIDDFWLYFARERKGALHTLDVATGETRCIHATEGLMPSHVDCHPTDPTLVRFCYDMYDAYGQRVWSIRTDGSALTKIRPQEYGELVTHEFWWADPTYIGYTYQDRRGDPTLSTHPWAEYSPIATHLGIADQSGREVYKSDPLNSYHTHLYMSPDGTWLCGEGTHDHSAVYAAPFDWGTTKVDLQPLAQVRTPYIAFRGQHVNCCFSRDNRWMLYTDTSDDGTKQVFAVATGV